jgi:hypothetical protein
MGRIILAEEIEVYGERPIPVSPYSRTSLSWENILGENSYPKILL